MTDFKDYIKQIVPMTQSEWEALHALFSPITLEKGDFFAQQGRHETHIGFLENGIMRAYYCNAAGTEYNKTFFTQNNWVGAYTALVTQQPNQINIQALAPCRVWVAEYQKITALFDQYPRIERLCRRLAELFYISKEKREIEKVMLDASARYVKFRLEYPDLENQIPQYHIASYLGVTPTQLSRIRGKK